MYFFRENDFSSYLCNKFDWIRNVETIWTIILNNQKQRATIFIGNRFDRIGLWKREKKGNVPTRWFDWIQWMIVYVLLINTFNHLFILAKTISIKVAITFLDFTNKWLFRLILVIVKHEQCRSFQNLSPLILLASWRSLVMIVTLLAWIAHKLVSSKRDTR